MAHSYHWTLEQLLEEERRLRSLAEEQVRAYRKLLVNLAMHLAPHVVDARRRENPHFPNGLSPEGWQALFAELPALSARRNGWGGQPQAQADLEQMKRQVQHLEAEKDGLRQQIETLEAELAKVRTGPDYGPDEGVNGCRGERVQAIHRSTPPSPAHPLPPSPQHLALPAAPPARFASRFHNWEREGLVLALLAVTGWSLRHAIDEALAERVGIGVGSGSTKRVFRRLEQAGLVQNQVYDLGDLRAAILLLTEPGETVAQAIGYPPVVSEWARLMQRHGGTAQAKHAALCCTFAYQARRRGWMVQLCPQVDGPSQPDVLLVREEQSIYVEVEAESGEPERRMRKWRNQADLQGFVALCANTASVRERLVVEARAAARHGVATDVASLIQRTRHDDDELWVERWGHGAVSTQRSAVSPSAPQVPFPDECR